MKNVLLLLFDCLRKHVFCTWSFWVLCFPAIFAYAIGNKLDAQWFFLFYILWKLRIIWAPFVALLGFGSLLNSLFN